MGYAYGFGSQATSRENERLERERPQNYTPGEMRQIQWPRLPRAASLRRGSTPLRPVTVLRRTGSIE